MSNANTTVDGVYKYQMSWRLIVLGLVFATTLFLFFGSMALAGTHNLMLFRAINVGPVVSRLAWIGFSGLGFFFGLIYLANAVWTATGGRQITVSNTAVCCPPWLSRTPKAIPYQQIEQLRVKTQGGRLECIGMGRNGKKLFRVDSWQFASAEEFVDFVTQVQSRGGIGISQ